MIRVLFYFDLNMNFIKLTISSLLITFILSTHSFASSSNNALDKLTQGIIVNNLWRIQANDKALQIYSIEAENRIKKTFNIDELNDTQKLAAKQIVDIFLSMPEKILLNPLHIAQAKQILLENFSMHEIQDLYNSDEPQNPETYSKLANADLKITELGSTLIEQKISDPIFMQNINDEIQLIIQKLDSKNEIK